jgi:hypothetical protein
MTYYQEGQTPQWRKEKDRQHNGEKKDKQRSTNKTKDRETQKRGGHRCSERVSSSCSTSGNKGYSDPKQQTREHDNGLTNERRCRI